MIKYFVALTLIVSCSWSEAADVGQTNEILFEQCKTYERLKSTPPANTKEMLAGISCLSYMAGAFEIYNYKVAGACSFEKKTVNEFVSDYIAYTRQNGLLNQKPAVTVFMLLETCYCDNEPAMKKFSCPSTR